MLIPDFSAPHWVGLLDAAGVLAVLLLWRTLADASPRARGIAGVGGGVLLLLVAARAFERVTAVAFGSGFGFLSGEHAGRYRVEVALAVVALAAGAFAATLHPFAVAAAADGEQPEPVELPPLPEALWSRPEVIGDAPEHDGELPDDPDDPDDLDDAPSGDRAVVVPLLAIVGGLGLPIVGYGTSTPSAGLFDSSGAHPHLGTFGIATHLVVGAVAGVALLGALLALDVYVRRLAAVAFVVVAAGMGLQAAWPQPFANETWGLVAGGLATGLLVPAALAALRRLVDADRRTVLAGLLAALVLTAGWGFVSGRAYLEHERNQGLVTDVQSG